MAGIGRRPEESQRGDPGRGGRWITARSEAMAGVECSAIRGWARNVCPTSGPALNSPRNVMRTPTTRVAGERQGFPDTWWTLVLNARGQGPEARACLSQLL